MLRLQPLLLALSLGVAPFHLASAQQYTYTTSTVTSCGPTPPPGAGGAAGAGGEGASPTLLGPGNLIVGMPPCPACDCAACVHSDIYTTSFGAFCPHGTTAMAYTITEVYSGMSAAPTLVDRPDCPPGFTTKLETCTLCGDKPITATMTYPVGGSPYVPGMAAPTPTGGAGSPGTPVPTPVVPAGGNNATVPPVAPIAAASHSHVMGTWALILASSLFVMMLAL